MGLSVGQISGRLSAGAKRERSDPSEPSGAKWGAQSKERVRAGQCRHIHSDSRNDIKRQPQMTLWSLAAVCAICSGVFALPAVVNPVARVLMALNMVTCYILVQPSLRTLVLNALIRLPLAVALLVCIAIDQFVLQFPSHAVGAMLDARALLNVSITACFCALYYQSTPRSTSSKGPAGAWLASVTLHMTIIVLSWAVSAEWELEARSTRSWILTQAHGHGSSTSSSISPLDLHNACAALVLLLACRVYFSVRKGKPHYSLSSGCPSSCSPVASRPFPLSGVAHAKGGQERRFSPSGAIRQARLWICVALCLLVNTHAAANQNAQAFVARVCANATRALGGVRPTFAALSGSGGAGEWHPMITRLIAMLLRCGWRGKIAEEFVLYDEDTPAPPFQFASVRSLQVSGVRG